MSTATLKLDVDADRFIAAANEFADLAAALVEIPESVAEAVGRIGDAVNLLDVHSHRVSAGGAGHQRIVFEPSQSFVDLLATLRAVERPGDLLGQLPHPDAPAGDNVRNLTKGMAQDG